MPSADLVLRNGRIITVDARSTVAEAIAINEDRILAVGSDAEIAAFVGDTTRVHDLAGRAVTPGLIDGHAHMDREGLRGVFPSIGSVRSIRDIQERIAALARAKAPGEWIVTMPIGDPPYYLGMPDALAEKRWPTRRDLDEAAPRNPVYIRPIWGFWRGTFPLVSCANSMALELADITRATTPPTPTVSIEKDARGEPTVVFVEQEMAPIVELTWFRDAARFSHTDRLRALPESARAYHASGTTSIFEGHWVASEVLRVYKQTHHNGALTMRSTLAMSPSWAAVDGVPLGPFLEAWVGWLAEPGPGDDWLKMSGLFVQDWRSPGEEARIVASPYTGWAGFNASHGLPRDQARDLLFHCAANGIRAVAIAGAAGLGILDLYDEIDREIPINGRRWVLAHTNVLSPRDVERIARMGLVLTTHTNQYLYKALGATAAKIPPEQHDQIVPMQSLRDSGVMVSLGTDNVPISLFWPIQQVIRRMDYATGSVFGQREALSRMDALRCATLNGAYLTFDEQKKGSLEPGKLADLAVLSADPLTVPDEALSDITALMTMVGGKVVHETPNWSGR